MPRNSVAVIQSKKIDHKVQAIVRSERSHWGRPQKKRYRPVPSVTKKVGSRVPPPQIERIKQRHILGQSQREIARAEGRSRPTIARIVKSEEMQAFVQEMRERFYGLGPDALATIEYAIREQKDARIAYEVLRDVGVAPRKGDPPQLPETTPENGYSRQAILMANCLLEARENLGVDLPADFEQALEKGSPKSTKRAKTSQAKLPRR